MRSTTIRFAPRRPRRAFTLIELLVVVGLVVLLIGLLLPALAKVRTQSRNVASESVMRGLGDAADSFFMAVGRYPGYVPEGQLNRTDGVWDEWSSTENALVELLGGLVPESDSVGDEVAINIGDRVKIDRDKIGDGPTVNGAKYNAFLVPDPRNLRYVNGQLGQATVTDNSPDEGVAAFPDLVDDWGMPILFWRNSGQKPRDLDEGMIVARHSDNAGAKFYYAGLQSYTNSTGLVGDDETIDQSSQSLLSADGNGAIDELAQVLTAHPSLAGTARGGYVILGAGADGVYFGREDFNGDPASITADDLQDFDDLILVGGSE